MSDIIIRDKKYVLYYRNGVKRVKNWSGVMCDEDAQREGYYNKVEGLLLHFNYGYFNTGHPTFEEFCHQMGVQIEHETENRILFKNVDPWICFTEGSDLVLYFGKDKPIRKTKTYTKVSKHVRFWRATYKWDDIERHGNEYYYWDVKDKKKLVVCQYSTLLRTFPEFIDVTNSHDNWYTVDLTQVEPFKESEHNYEYPKEKIDEIVRKQKEEAEQARKWREELERRKQTPGYCCKCGAEHADYVANPYYHDMYGEIIMQYLCPRCYEDIAGDI